MLICSMKPINEFFLTLVTWAVHRDQSRIDKFFNAFGHTEEFKMFADYLFDNIKTQYKKYIFKDCPESLGSKDQWPSDLHGKLGEYWVSISCFKNPIANPLDKSKRNCIAVGCIGFFDYQKIKHTDGHWRHIPFFIDDEGYHTSIKGVDILKNKNVDIYYTDSTWLLETRRVKLPYTQLFITKKA